MGSTANVGGQAVIEGVMMRSAASSTVAVRRPSGEIVIREQTWHSRRKPGTVWNLPFVRGVVVLFESIAGGFDALSFSAEQAAKTDEEREQLQQGGLTTFISFALSIALAIGLFVALPHGLAWGAGRYVDGLSLDSIAFHALAGSFKLAIFMSYLGVLSLIPDIKRVFMYHGAEHKAIATFEAGEPLDVKHAREHTTFHARCGTSFMLIVIVLAIVMFSIIFPMIPGLKDNLGGHALAIVLKVPLMFPVAGAAYEFNRWAATRLDAGWVRMLVTPGFWLQRLTTREPTDDMLEVALASLKSALARDKKESETESLDVYTDFVDVCGRI